MSAQAQTWATPKVSAGGYTYSKGDPEKPIPSLAGQAAMWPTPNATDGDKGPTTYARGNLSLPESANRFPFSPPAPPIPDGLPSLKRPRTSRRRLNPEFVCWLMGWPPFWTIASTGCECSATASSLWLRRMRGELSRLASAPAIEADGQMLLFGSD